MLSRYHALFRTLSALFENHFNVFGMFRREFCIQRTSAKRATAMTRVSSWGRLTPREHQSVALSDRGEVAARIAASTPGVAHGMGRSYGDVCLNGGGVLWHTTGLDRFIAFDPVSGRLRCEAGVLLREIQALTVAQGWILPVTPGTQLITVGGAIANDVHGKNHHRQGSFGDHLLGLTLVRTDGQVVECGPQQQPDWFAATVGGLGLTGVIVTAEIQLCRVAGPWLETETIAYHNLDEFFQLADSSEPGWEHTVSWIDALAPRGARGLFLRANPSARQDPPPAALAPRSLVLTPPCSLVRPVSVRAFNQLYFWLKQRRAAQSVQHYQGFFYPLDHLNDWNRMYGPRGFYQYQTVLPRAVGQDALLALLAEVARAGACSFLSVLKTFGQRQSLGMLSFPQPGVTLALDFPNHDAITLRLFQRLDAIVAEAGGRLYPAKDARMARALFVAGYPRLGEFLQYRDPGISSELSRRLLDS